MLACLAAVAGARDQAAWVHAGTPHFEIYSNSDAEAARRLALGFERLHAFFARQAGIAPPAQRQVRVIAFASVGEYREYRAHLGSDAYFLGTESRDYIVMPAAPRGDMRVAAHEYAHVLLHAGGWTLPEWLGEGIGDVVSTVQMTERDSHIGGDLPGRLPALRSGRWMTLPELFAFPLKAPPAGALDLFYAESWALTDLLMLSPDYSAGFPPLFAALASGVGAERALSSVYGKPLEAIARDLRDRVARGRGAVPLPAVPGTSPEVRVEPVTAFAARAMLADLRMANGERDLAESAFRELALERPDAGNVHAALGALALGRGDTTTALAEWKRAVESGLADADLCFRYAELAGVSGLPVRDALERGLAIRPEFDDAHFKLALLDNNESRAEAAISHLRAMRRVAPARAFTWWSTLAGALLDLDRRGEAKQAAAQALAHAGSDAERERAAGLEWLADTELAVEIEAGSFHTVRVPVGVASRNPFIEAGDRAQRIEATLRRVECADSGIQLVVETAQGQLTLAIADPSRVQIRNAGSVTFEFVCGPQEGSKVLVEYAPAGLLLRGLEFR